LTDYPNDPGCDNQIDISEELECNDEIDNDGDGLTDMNDPQCRNIDDNSETYECNNRKDDNNNSYYDYSPPTIRNKDYSGCISVFDDFELDTNECNDGIDNDGDGRIDAIGDPGCFNEIDPSELFECNDRIDNDGDGLTDYPNDRMCTSNEDHSELFDCVDGIDNDGDGMTDYPFDTECNNFFDFSEEPECNDGIDNDEDGFIDYPQDSLCINSTDNSENYECYNNIDDDRNSFFDYFAVPMTKRDYSRCVSVFDDSESINNTMGECDDGIDNNENGLTDFLEELGCFSRYDPSEDSECNDGIDNDGDGFIDYPSDNKCRNIFDHTELFDCNDGIDNDEDNTTDYGVENIPDENNNPDERIRIDLECDNYDDPSEKPQCSDGIDNDGDGFIDLDDNECDDLNDNIEASGCVDRMDNDYDDYADAEDPGCNIPFESDNDELNPPINRTSFFEKEINERFTAFNHEFVIINMTQENNGSMKLLINGGQTINTTINLSGYERNATIDGVYIEAIMFGETNSTHSSGLLFIKYESDSNVYLLKQNDSPISIYDENVSLAYTFSDRRATFLFYRDGLTSIKQLRKGISIRRIESYYNYTFGNMDSYYSDIPYYEYAAVKVE
ncbi:MAG: hypothetical protein QXG00_03565, partial [Candidatus Woesearchaeota archaeon]